MSLLDKKVEYFIGHRAYDKIGRFRYSEGVLKSHLLYNFNKDIEVLYSEYKNGCYDCIGISDIFGIVWGCEKIPFYDLYFNSDTGELKAKKVDDPADYDDQYYDSDAFTTMVFLAYSDPREVNETKYVLTDITGNFQSFVVGKIYTGTNIKMAMMQEMIDDAGVTIDELIGNGFDDDNEGLYIESKVQNSNLIIECSKFKCVFEKVKKLGV